MTKKEREAYTAECMKRLRALLKKGTTIYYVVKSHHMTRNGNSIHHVMFLVPRASGTLALDADRPDVVNITTCIGAVVPGFNWNPDKLSLRVEGHPTEPILYLGQIMFGDLQAFNAFSL